MKSLGGAIAIVSPQIGGLIATAGGLHAKLAVLQQTQGATATAAGRFSGTIGTLSASLMAFVGTPLGLVATGFATLLALMESARKEGESTGDTMLRLTDIIHGLASAQAQANREMERSNEISRQQFDREQQRQRAPLEKPPEGQALLGEQREIVKRDQQIASLREQRAAAEKELKWRLEEQIGTTDFRSREAMTELEKKYAERSRWWGIPKFSNVSLEQEIRSIPMAIQQLENQKKEIFAGLPELERQKIFADRKRWFGLDPDKSAGELKQESAEKVAQRESAERLDQDRNRVRRAQEEDEARRAAEERRKRREEDAARRAEAAERKREREEDQDRRVNRELRGRGFSGSERRRLGIAAVFGNIADFGREYASGVDREQHYTVGAVEDQWRKIQEAMTNKADQAEQERARKQSQDISDLVDGKKTIKVEVMKAPQQVAVFGR